MMGCVSLDGRPWFILILFGLLILMRSWPLIPGQLSTFGDVNPAYAIGHYDARMVQPQPPGYPPFVREMHVLHWLRFKRAEGILSVLALAGSVAAMLLLVFAGNRILENSSGLRAGWSMLPHPVFWRAGRTSARRIQLAVVPLLAGICCWRVWEGDGRWVKWSAVGPAGSPSPGSARPPSRPKAAKNKGAPHQRVVGEYELSW